MRHDTHAAMLNCEHTEADALGPVCIGCGRVAFDPSWCVLAIAGLYAAVHFLVWVAGRWV